jgi:hypothetical protein
MKRLIVILIVGCLLGAGAVHAAPPAPYVNIIQNGNFNAGFSSWTQASLTWDVVPSGWLEAYQPSGSGSFYQDLAYSASANDLYNIIIEVGNRSSSARILGVALYSTIAPNNAVTCDFTIPANTSLQPYRMLTKAPGAWANMRLQIFPGGSAPSLLIDNVTLQYSPASQVTSTVCTSPPAPTPTPTPTPNFFSEFELSEGNAARVENTVTAGDYVEILLLFVLVISFWGVFILRELRGDKS